MLDFFQNYGTIGLFLYAILETLTLVPPTETIQLPLSTGASNEMIVFYSIICAVGTIVGIILMYYLIKVLNLQEVFKKVIKNEEIIKKGEVLFNKHGMISIIIAGFTPIPYTVILYVSFISGLSLKKSLLASLVSRILRFFALGFALILAKDFLDIQLYNSISKYLNIIFIGVTVLGIGGMFFGFKKKKSA